MIFSTIRDIFKGFAQFFPRILPFLFFCIFFLFCCQSNSPQINPSFYHWQTNFNLSTTEQNFLSDLAVSKLYIKFFDVDWDYNQQTPVAKATLIKSTDFKKTVALVPTIFITNRTLTQLEETAIPDLSQKIYTKLTEQMVDFPDSSIREIQIDCDWTQGTRANYFQLLQLLKKELEPASIFLSATIRLHQIKYPEKTGIPPVSRGMLMYYNMGEVRNYDTQNSILDNAIGAQYLDRLSTYALPLDVALPLFQWGVLFRNDKMIQLLNQLSAKDMEEEQRFRKIAENRWQIIKSTYLDGVYLYQNDEIRLEKVERSDLIKAANLLTQQLKKENRTVAFYHLDEAILQQFPVIDLVNLMDIFKG